MANSRRRTRKRSYITGEKGKNRVRLYPHPRDGSMMLEYRDEDGAKKRLSRKHSDFERGKIAANQLAVALLSHEGPASGELTLKALFDNYEREVTAGRITKTPGKQRHDKRARQLFEKCWGSSTRVRSLDVTHWNAFITQRRSGVLRPLEELKSNEPSEIA